MRRQRLITIRIPFAAATVWMSVTATALAADYNLAPRYERGAEVYYISHGNIDHRLRADAAGVDEQIRVRTESGMSLAVTEVNTNGSAELRWTLHYLALTTTAAMPGIPELLDYDSRQPGAGQSPLAPMFARLLERPVTLRVDAAGRVLDFHGLDTGPSGGGLMGMANPLDTLANSFFTKEAFEQLPLFITAHAPSPAKPRDTWNRTTAINMPMGVGSLMVHQAFEFKKANRRRKTANIAMTGTVTKTNSPGALGAMIGGALDVDEGKMSGQFAWDLLAGQVSSGETRLQLRTSLTTPLGPVQLMQDMSSSITRSTAKRVGHKQTPPPPSKSDPRRPQRGT